MKARFDLTVPTLWKANCEDPVSLRKSADDDGAVLADIPAGETVELRQWKERFALVTWGALEGYVLASRIKPVDDDYLPRCLDTVVPTDTYTYEQLLADMESLKSAYPGVVETAGIGRSEQGREIPVLRIGSTDAKYQVLLQGAIHAREHMNAWLLMAMADYWLDHGILDYGNVCYHIIPMSNPDGAAVSQRGALNETQRSIYQSDLELGYTAAEETAYAARWKANALGTDLNRNFPSGWETIVDHNVPASEKFRGEEPFSAAEAKALRDYTLAYPFDVTLSYHSTGSVIYYDYGNKQPVNGLSKALGEAVKAVTGYELEGWDTVDGAGYKDWVIDALEIPSLTIETGSEAAPLALGEIYSVFARNYRVLPTVARWLQRK